MHYSLDLLEHLLKNCHQQLAALITKLQNRVADAPEGTLHIVRKGQSIQYYRRLEAKDTNGKYLKNSEYSLVRQLAQKDYDEKILTELQRQIRVLEKIEAKFQPENIQGIYTKLHPCRKTLILPIALPDNLYATKWKDVTYEKKGFAEDFPEFYTDQGERVRSKSEIIIANKLARLGIAYRYEYPILFKSGYQVHPDFYCLNLRTRREFAWEHFGMMDNAEYAGKALRKIEEYAENGFWPGVNFITTFESLGRPLNLKLVEKTIRQYLL